VQTTYEHIKLRTSGVTGVSRNLKRGGPGGTFQVYIFKNCSHFSIFFTLNISTHFFSLPKGPLNTPLLRTTWCVRDSCEYVKIATYLFVSDLRCLACWRPPLPWRDRAVASASVPETQSRWQRRRDVLSGKALQSPSLQHPCQVPDVHWSPAGVSSSPRARALPWKRKWRHDASPRATVRARPANPRIKWLDVARLIRFCVVDDDDVAKDASMTSRAPAKLVPRTPARTGSVERVR